MTRFGTRVAGVALATALIGSCGDDEGGGDVASFCSAVEALAADDPFDELAVASPQEMRAAFDQLRDGVEDIARSAPDDLSGRADRYLESVDDLIDQLRGAGYDPRQLDTLRYGAATDAYEEAAVSIENAADDACG